MKTKPPLVVKRKPSSGIPQGKLEPTIAFHVAFGRWYSYTGGQHPPPSTLSLEERNEWNRLRHEMRKAWDALEFDS